MLCYIKPNDFLVKYHYFNYILYIKIVYGYFKAYIIISSLFPTNIYDSDTNHNDGYYDNYDDKYII